MRLDWTHVRSDWTLKNSEKWYFYRPQRSCGKVMFLHMSVILSTGEGDREGHCSGRTVRLLLECIPVKCYEFSTIQFWAEKV